VLELLKVYPFLYYFVISSSSLNLLPSPHRILIIAKRKPQPKHILKTSKKGQKYETRNLALRTCATWHVRAKILQFEYSNLEFFHDHPMLPRMTVPPPSNFNSCSKVLARPPYHRAHPCPLLFHCFARPCSFSMPVPPMFFPHFFSFHLFISHDQ